MKKTPVKNKINLEFLNEISLIRYDLSLTTYESVDTKKWFFVIEILSIVEENILAMLHGQSLYDTYEKAILNAYTVSEYLGFSIANKKIRAQIGIYRWDEKISDYVEEVQYFDGDDFFKNPS